MTYYGGREIARSFLTVRGNTVKIAEEIPEERYGFRPVPELRSVAETLVHIAVSTRVPAQIHFVERLTTLVGFDYFGWVAKIQAEQAVARSKQEILALLKDEGDKYARLVEGVTDEFLAEQVKYPEPMQPPVKSRFEMLIAPKEHEMHHRAQLMVSQRLIGLTPHFTRQMMEFIERAKAAQG